MVSAQQLFYCILTWAPLDIVPETGQGSWHKSLEHVHCKCGGHLHSHRLQRWSETSDDFHFKVLQNPWEPNVPFRRTNGSLANTHFAHRCCHFGVRF